MNFDPLSRVALGRTGLSVSPLCFGLAPLGDMPDTYGYSVGVARATDGACDLRRSGQLHRHVAELWHGPQRAADRRGDCRASGGIPEGFVISSKLDRDMDT